MQMQNFDGGFGGPVDFKEILEQVSSDDIMFVYEGVAALRTALQSGDEKSLSKFPYDTFCKKLVSVIQQPALMDISNEIKLLAMLCLFSIMDIFPQHVGYLVSLDFVGAIKETMNESMGYIDLVEQCIKCSERISQEYPRDVLKRGLLQMAFNMLDFFDKSTQTKIMQLLLNVSKSSEQEQDFQDNLLPVIPNVCQLMQNGVHSDSDKQKIEQLSQILQNVAVSFLHFVEAFDFCKVSSFYDQLSCAGAVETSIEILAQYSNYIQQNSLKLKSSKHDHIISTESNQTFTEATISNLLKVLEYSCQYSHQVVMQLTSAGIFEILEPLLPEEGDEDDHSQVVSDVLSLIQAMLPAGFKRTRQELDEIDAQQMVMAISMDDQIQEEGEGTESDLEKVKEVETRADKEEEVSGVKGVAVNEEVQALKAEVLAAKEALKSVQEARNKHEAEKKLFFQNQETSLHIKIVKSLLPKIFMAYSQQINNNFRTKCLSLIQRMLQVLPQPLLVESFDPASFTKFIHMILRQQQPQQVLLCLETVSQILDSEYGPHLSFQFIRHGIRETISEFTTDKSIELLNAIEPSKPQSKDLGTKDLIYHMAEDRERISDQFEGMKHILDDQNIPEAKREEVSRMMKKSEELLKSIDKKTQELQLIDQRLNTMTKETPQQQGTQIAELAKVIKDRFLDNEAYWADVVKQHPEEAEFYQVITQLAGDMLTEARSTKFNLEKSQSLMSQLATVLTSKDGGLTSFEFVKSGLLESIQSLLTIVRFEDTLLEETKEEITPTTKEVKTLNQDQAVAFILRFKCFVDAMCQKLQNQLPFRALFALCHEQLTLAEPIIFKEPSQDQVDQHHQLNRGLIVNLIYDPDGSKSGNPTLPEESKELSSVHNHRNKLYEQLNEMPLPIRSGDTIHILEEFLLKRVKTQQDVTNMVSQANRHFGMIARMQPPLANAQEEGLKPELQELYDRMMDRMSQFIDESVDQEYFNEQSSTVAAEMLAWVQEWETENELGVKAVPESFYRYLGQQTSSLIETIAREEYEEMEQEEIPEDERELILQEIQIKTTSFLSLIVQVKSQAFKWDNFSKLDKTGQVSSLPDSFLDSIELEEQEVVSSHPHTLTKRPEEYSGSWRCDKITGSMVCRGGVQQFRSGIQGWRCQDCDFDLCLTCMKINRYLDNKNNEATPKSVNSQVKDTADESKEVVIEVTIEELLKHNEDVQIEFVYNQRIMEHSITFAEIAKEKPTLEKKASLQEGSPQSMAQKMLGGQHDFRSIYFRIKDKAVKAIKVDKVEEQPCPNVQIPESKSSVTFFVQSLIDSFNLPDLQFPKPKPTTSKEDPKPIENQAQYTSLEHSLKLLKVLWHIFENTSTYIQSGIQLLTSQSFPSDDLLVQHLQTELAANHFHHSKLNTNLQKVISEPTKFNTGLQVNHTLKLIYQECPFLFIFDTKLLYLRLQSFMKVDPQRSLFFFTQNLKKSNKQSQQQLQREPSKPIERQKVQVDRSVGIVEQALQCSKQWKNRAILEIVYKDEEGTGLGPTLEFYSLVGKELRSDVTMWREHTADSMLYPRCMPTIGSSLYEQESKQIKEKFTLVGALVARSLLDDRLVDLPLSPLMWDLVLGKKFNLYHLKKLDQNMFALFSELQLMANQKHEIDSNTDKNADEKKALYEEVKSSKNASIEDYSLTFYNPSNENCELIKDGSNVEVTLDNLQQYIDLVLESTFQESVSMQINAFRSGFNTMLPIEALKQFDTQSELETLICGQAAFNQNSEEWTDTNRLGELINTAHGYHQKSKAFKMLLQYISEVKPEERSTFIQFLTGSPRLPMGGFGALDPRLTVVLKKPASYQKETADMILPSVMTCQNYVKMPDYSSYEALKAKFDLAIREGSVGFTLS